MMRRGWTGAVIVVVAACGDTVLPGGVVLDRIVISPDSVQGVPAGDTVQLTATVYDTLDRPIPNVPVTWTSSFNGWARPLEDGLIEATLHHGVDIRPAIITAEALGLRDSVVVRVVPATVDSVRVDPDSLFIRTNQQNQYAATPYHASGLPLLFRDVAWQVSDMSVGQSQGNGFVRAVGPGTAWVRATIGGVTDSARLGVGNIVARITRWNDGDLVADSIGVAVSVSSAYQVVRVTIHAGTQVAEAVPSSATLWVATFPLSGEGYGPVELRATAEDVFGATYTAETISVVHNPAPTVTVTAPRTFAEVASPNIQVQATCIDPDAPACASFMVRLSSGTVLATGNPNLATTISLAAYEAQYVTLYFIGADSAGQTDTVTRRVQAFSGAFLDRQSLEVPGYVLDYDGSRALYHTLQNDSQVYRLREADGTDVVVLPDSLGRIPIDDEGFLFPGGAIFNVAEDYARLTAVFEYRDGTTTQLAPAGTPRRLRVEGAWAAWPASGGYHRRDLVGGTMSLVPANPVYSEIGISASGTLVFPGPGGLAYWPAAGSPDTLASATGPNAPLIHGDTIVYHAGSAQDGYRVHLRTVSGTDTALTDSEPDRQVPGSDYQVAGGWVAFTRRSQTGERQVWIRRPDGSAQQVTFYSTSSAIEALRADGALIVRNVSNRLLSLPPHTSLRSLGTARGMVRIRGDEFVILLDEAVFVVQD